MFRRKKILFLPGKVLAQILKSTRGDEASYDLISSFHNLIEANGLGRLFRKDFPVLARLLYLADLQGTEYPGDCLDFCFFESLKRKG
jgi:hypothetical protein